MGTEVERLHAVRDRVRLVAAARRPEERVATGSRFIGGGDIVAGMEVESRSPVRGPPIHVIEGPERCGVGIADVLPAAVVEAVRLLNAVRDAVLGGGGPKTTVELLIAA